MLKQFLKIFYRSILFLYKIPPQKRLIFLLLFDNFLIFLSLYLTLSILLLPNNIIENISSLFYLFPLSLFLGSLIYYFTGHLKPLTRFIGSIDCYKIFIRNIILSIFISLFFKLSLFDFNVLNFVIILTFLLSNFIIITRIILRDLLFKFYTSKKEESKKVAIYGAGDAGLQLLNSINISRKFKVLYFIDDDINLKGRLVKGIKIKTFDEIISLTKNLDHIILAIPSLTGKDKKKLIRKVLKLNVSFLEIPKLEDINLKKTKIDNIRNVDIEEILGRDVVLPDKSLFGPGIENKNVFITGAGGSIGSELSIQVMSLKPSNLIILDHSENALYAIQQKLNSLLANSTTKIFYFLGSCIDENLIHNIFSQYAINTVFHAAAYKHVPLVESNPLVGLKNNTFATRIICQNSMKYGVERLVMISSDKAVRPTNIMGASKRLSELIILGFSRKILNSTNNKNKTVFSMVRFGNVLGSSGSVVPLFKQQIESGGPITLTHSKVIRYFMTVEEAVQLVIQTSVMGIGGDVFLLDMGEPVLIKDLAEQMIRISGLKVKNEKNTDGDIEIVCTGLRPGEKLFEELLINGKSKPTKHPLIKKAAENLHDNEIFWDLLESFEDALNKNDKKKTFLLLKKLVPEWNIFSEN